MIADMLISQMTDLKPPAPAVLKLLALLDQPDSDADEVIRIVERDGVLSAKVLSVCNSAWFGNGTPIASISQALLRLGFAKIHRIVMAVSFGTLMNIPLTGYAIDNQELWQHSLLSALLAREVLEEATGFHSDPSIVFTAALLHDIGKLVLDTALDEEAQNAIRTLIAEDGQSRLEGERRIIGCDHCEVGAHLLTRWNLPANIVEAVAHHHAPPLDPKPAISSIVHIADTIAHGAGSAPGWDSFAVPIIGDVPKILGITSEAMERLMITAFDFMSSEPELALTHEHSA